MVWDDHWIPPSRASWPAIKALTFREYKVGGGGGGPHGHMLLIHLHTDRQSGHVTTIPNTPVPRPNPSQPPPYPQLTPDDPYSHLLQGSGMCWLARGGVGWGVGLRGGIGAPGLVMVDWGACREFVHKAWRGSKWHIAQIFRKMSFLTPVCWSVLECPYIWRHCTASFC